MKQRGFFLFLFFFFFFFFFLGGRSSYSTRSVVEAAPPSNFFVVLNTWPWPNATDAAWEVASNPLNSSVDAVVAGCTTCEEQQCDFTVGYGGSPDESGETTLDAMIMDGATHDVGAVADLQNIKNAIGVARAVMDFTTHTLLAGQQATEFALQMGFSASSLTTLRSNQQHIAWLEANCQPNYWINVSPNSSQTCGPYTPNPPPSSSSSSSLSSSSSQPNHHSSSISSSSLSSTSSRFFSSSSSSSTVSKENHDTVGMIVLDQSGNIAAGASTNGMIYKIPGRVGDAPIPGSGAYADNDAGGCAETGDGDTMMRFSPCYQTVENMRLGMTPTAAAEDAILRILKKYPTFLGGIVAMNMNGEIGAAGANWNFTYTYRYFNMTASQIVTVPPVNF